MKTITELINDTKNVQSAISTLCQDLAELEASSQHQNSDIHIGDFMQMARHYKIDGHILGKTKDNLSVEAYFVLLFSIALKNVPTDVKTHPLIYPCRVAASFTHEPDVELYFKKSLVLDEKTIHQYIDAIQKENLRDNFIIDALLMTATYDKGNLAKLDFIADLASLMAISEDEMNEILTIVSAVLNKIDFWEINLNHIGFFRVRYYLKDCEVLLITMPDCVYYGGNGNSGFNTDEQIVISDKKDVIIENIDISDIKFKSAYTPVFSFINIKNIKMVNCTFSNIKNDFFKFQDVGNILIEECSFTHFHRVIFYFSHIVGEAIIKNSRFQDCHRSTVEGYRELEYGGVIGTTFGLKKLICQNDIFF